MARAQGIKLENNFSLGLVTETTELRYPPNSCVDILNCVVEEEGLVKRRPPFDIESSTASASDLGHTLVTEQLDKPVVEFVWTSVGGDGDKSFLVIQIGRYISFYDVSESSTDTMTNKQAFEVDLEAYVVSGSSLVAGDYPCSFANGRGKLVVVNRAIDPILIEYDFLTNSIIVEQFALKFRDFEGVTNLLASETTRPTGSVAGLTSSNPNHIYNLYNAGWKLTDALTQWDTARADLPSLCDTVGTFRASETDAFDPTKVGPKNNGNTLAPRGHFILTLGVENRSALSGVSVDGDPSSLGFGDAWSIVSETMTANASIAYGDTLTVSPSLANVANVNDDDNTDYADATSTIGLSIGGGGFRRFGGARYDLILEKTFTSASKIHSINVKSPAALQYTTISTTQLTTPGVVMVTVTGYVGATPTVITNAFISNVANNTTVLVSTDPFTVYDKVQIKFTCNYQLKAENVSNPASATFRFYLASLEVTEPLDTVRSYERPQIAAFFAGRIWYAASGYNEKGTNVYFSQVLERDEQFGLCYQTNDPTSEYFFDLLASDGGSVSIPEIANVVGLFPMRSAMVVLATNGIWVIRGSSSEGFSATSYRVEKVTSTGCVSRYSVCDMKGLPVWMGEDSIYTLEYDPNFNAFQLKSLSDERIRTYIKSIPASRKVFSKIQYDTTEQTLRILFYTNSAIAGDRFYYNTLLNYDINSKAWFPWQMVLVDPIVGMINVADANHVYPALLKFIFQSNGIEASNKIYFGDFKSDASVFQDYENFVNTYATGSPESKYAYQSYFVTAPMMDAQLMKFFQSNYIMVFLNTVANSSCAVQGQFDWTSSGNSGKWSTSQELYRVINNSRLSYRRLKIRGKGRALSLKFRSTGTGPFEIIGWAINETANQGV